MKEKEIRHEGEISEINGNIASIKVFVNSGCSACQIKGHCSLSKTQIKYINVKIKGGQFYTKDKVEVIISSKTGITELFYTYYLPVLIVLIAMVFGHLIFKIESIISGLSLLFLILYYVIFILMKKKFKKSVTYSLIKKPSGF